MSEEKRSYRRSNLTEDIVLGRLGWRWSSGGEVCERIYGSVDISRRQMVLRALGDLVAKDLAMRKGSGSGSVFRRRSPDETQIPDRAIELDCRDLLGMHIDIYFKLSRFKFESALSVARREKLPLASLYRHLKKWVASGLVEVGDKELTQEGTRYRVYTRRYRKVIITESGEVQFYT